MNQTPIDRDALIDETTLVSDVRTASTPYTGGTVEPYSAVRVIRYSEHASFDLSTRPLIADEPRKVLRWDPSNVAFTVEGRKTPVSGRVSGGSDPLPERMARLEQRMESQDARLAELKQSMSDTEARLTKRIEDSERRVLDAIKAVNTQLETLGNRTVTIGERLSHIEGQIAMARWFIPIMVALGSIVAGVIVALLE